MATKRVITSLKDFELWRSAIEGEIWIKQYDRRGDEISVRVPAGKEFRILPEERKINQELAAEPHLDPFQNGHLIPVQLVESAEDFEELQGNPNHLTENDMRGLLDDPKNLDALKSGLALVSNPTTLVRLLAIAEDRDETTLKQVKAIEDRLQQVQQQTDYEEVETVGAVTTSEGRDVVATKAPLSPAPFNPNMGRRALER
jgi:hypothetical protein